MALDLVPIWTVILAISVFMYVLLDGFDLGVGRSRFLQRWDGCGFTGEHEVYDR